MGAIVLGAITGVVCFFACTKIKSAFGYDDSLDVFGVHGVGGIVGCIFVGFCAYPELQGYGDHLTAGPGDTAIPAGTQTMIQMKSCLLTVVWSAVVAFVAIQIAKVLCGGLEVDEEGEDTGLDVIDHGEEGYTL